MRHVRIAMIAVAVCAPAIAQARGGGLATYHTPPCNGDDCKADDPRANSDCKGWLCGISSAKAMQRPVTAAEAEALARAQAAAAQAAPAPLPAEAAKPPAKPKRAAKAKAKPAGTNSVVAATPSPAEAPKPPSAASSR